VLSLIRDARGQYKSFLPIPESTVNDALLVDLMTDERTVQRTMPNVSDIDLEFLEVQRGVAL
jgi:hypothetical protein